MPQTEADTTFDDTGLKPYTVSGNPLTPIEVTAGDQIKPADEGSETEEPEPSKTDLEALKAIRNREAKIQELSEELYGLNLKKALSDPTHLESLISGDTQDRRIASKILQRNAGHFGASTFEAWELKRAKENAGEDQTAQQLAEMRVKQSQLERKQTQSDWEVWKKENAVVSDVAKIADQVHQDNPTMSFGLVIAAARGLHLKQEPSSKAASSTATGSVGAPQRTEVDMSSPLAKALLRNVDMKRVERAAKKYL